MYGQSAKLLRSFKWSPKVPVPKVAAPAPGDKPTEQPGSLPTEQPPVPKPTVATPTPEPVVETEAAAPVAKPEQEAGVCSDLRLL